MARPSPRVALPPATTATDWRASIKRWLARLLLISLCAFLIVQLVIFSLLWYWRDHPVDYSMFMVLHQLGGGTVTQQWVPYEAISPNLKRALVAAEPERLVILEDAFKGNDELKTNLVQECRSRNVDLWTA